MEAKSSLLQYSLQNRVELPVDKKLGQFQDGLVTLFSTVACLDRKRKDQLATKNTNRLLLHYKCHQCLLFVESHRSSSLVFLFLCWRVRKQGVLVTQSLIGTRGFLCSVGLCKTQSRVRTSFESFCYFHWQYWTKVFCTTPTTSSVEGNLSSVLAPFFVGFTRVFCLFKTRRLFISCYVLENSLDSVFWACYMPCLVVGEWL
jgi:hypothetical protein